MRRPPDIADARAGWWTWRALRSARGHLREGEVRGVRLPAPPPVSLSGARAVRRVLQWSDASCLERSLVLQRWLAAHGVDRDVIVGTQGNAQSGFAAHAWIEGEPQPPGRSYVELIRLSP
jgi:hypothetical protein